jgi:hypothetical protein
MEVYIVVVYSITSPAVECAESIRLYAAHVFKYTMAICGASIILLFPSISIYLYNYNYFRLRGPIVDDTGVQVGIVSFDSAAALRTIPMFTPKSVPSGWIQEQIDSDDDSQCFTTGDGGGVKALRFLSNCYHARYVANVGREQVSSRVEIFDVLNKYNNIQNKSCLPSFLPSSSLPSRTNHSLNHSTFNATEARTTKNSLQHNPVCHHRTITRMLLDYTTIWGRTPKPTTARKKKHIHIAPTM